MRQLGLAISGSCQAMASASDVGGRSRKCHLEHWRPRELPAHGLADLVERLVVVDVDAELSEQHGVRGGDRRS